MEDKSGCCQSCKGPCAGGFKKAVDLEYSGLVIYLHTKKDEKKKPPSRYDDSYVLHNTSTKDLKKTQYVGELRKYKTKCSQCKTIIQRVRSLLDEIKAIRENDIIGVCEHCKQATQKNVSCKRCEFIVSKFIDIHRRRCSEREQRFKVWLCKVKHLLQALVDAESVCQHRVYKDAELERILQELKGPLSMREPDIDFFPAFDLEKLTSLRSLSQSKEMLEELLSKIKRAGEKRYSDDSLYPTPSRTCRCKHGHFDGECSGLGKEMSNLTGELELQGEFSKDLSQLLNQEVYKKMIKRLLELSSALPQRWHQSKEIIQALLVTFNFAINHELSKDITHKILEQLRELKNTVVTQDFTKYLKGEVIMGLTSDFRDLITLGSSENLDKNLLQLLIDLTEMLADVLSQNIPKDQSQLLLKSVQEDIAQALFKGKGLAQQLVKKRDAGKPEPVSTSTSLTRTIPKGLDTKQSTLGKDLPLGSKVSPRETAQGSAKTLPKVSPIDSPRELQKENLKASVKRLPKDTKQGSPKSLKDSRKGSPKGSPKDQIHGAAKGPPKDSIQGSPKGPPKDAMHGAAKGPPKDSRQSSPKGPPKEAMHGAAKGPPKDSKQGAHKGTLKDFAKGPAKDATQSLSKGPPKETRQASEKGAQKDSRQGSPKAAPKDTTKVSAKETKQGSAKGLSNDPTPGAAKVPPKDPMHGTAKAPPKDPMHGAAKGPPKETKQGSDKHKAATQASTKGQSKDKEQSLAKGSKETKPGKDKATSKETKHDSDKPKETKQESEKRPSKETKQTSKGPFKDPLHGAAKAPPKPLKDTNKEKPAEKLPSNDQTKESKESKKGKGKEVPLAISKELNKELLNKLKELKKEYDNGDLNKDLTKEINAVLKKTVECSPPDLNTKVVNELSDLCDVAIKNVPKPEDVEVIKNFIKDCLKGLNDEPNKKETKALLSNFNKALTKSAKAAKPQSKDIDKSKPKNEKTDKAPPPPSAIQKALQNRSKEEAKKDEPKDQKTDDAEELKTGEKDAAKKKTPKAKKPKEKKDKQSEKEKENLSPDKKAKAEKPKEEKLPKKPPDRVPKKKKISDAILLTMLKSDREDNAEKYRLHKERKLAKEKELEKKRLKALLAVKKPPPVKKKPEVVVEPVDTSDVLVCPTKQDNIKYMVKGSEVAKFDSHYKDEMEVQSEPLFFKACVEFPEPGIIENKLKKQQKKRGSSLEFENCFADGIIRYRLSNREFIDKGWTKLPTKKIMRRMNIYKMEPVNPKQDWFERHKEDKELFYDSGGRLADIDADGRGHWYYRNGAIALDYYNAEESNIGQRYVVYSSGEENDIGRMKPITVLGLFDVLGNGVVYDLYGNVRLKYNQSEGLLVDPKLGPPGRWKWHTLNDPPVLQQVFVNSRMEESDLELIEKPEKTEDANENFHKESNQEMLTIELENFVKEKATKLLQKFKPFQIRMKAVKLNEQFSLKIFDQANIYLLFRDGATSLKINLGRLLKSDEIIDTDTSDMADVATPYDKHPARSDSVENIQKILKTVRTAKVRTTSNFVMKVTG